MQNPLVHHHHTGVWETSLAFQVWSYHNSQPASHFLLVSSSSSHLCKRHSRSAASLCLSLSLLIAASHKILKLGGLSTSSSRSLALSCKLSQKKRGFKCICLCPGTHCHTIHPLAPDVFAADVMFWYWAAWGGTPKSPLPVSHRSFGSAVMQCNVL